MQIKIVNRFLFVGALIACAACQITHSPSHRERADDFRAEGKFDQAISEYQSHISYRESLANRPEWENPYIYLLDIGDIYLEQGDVNKALEKYLEAENRKVDQEYITDRLRNVGSWYEKREKLNEALEHLKKYRERDPLLFDPMLDRIAKAIVQAEEAGKPTPE